MAVDLFDYLPALKREVNPPGTDLLANVSDDDLVGSLVDGFWNAVLDKTLVGYSADEDGLITPTTASVEFPREYVALVILYAGIQILRNKTLSTQTRFSAKAGPVEFTTENSANVLTAMLAQLQAVKDRIVFLATEFGSVSIIDAFSARNASPASYAGYLYSLYAAFDISPSDTYAPVAPLGP